MDTYMLVLSNMIACPTGQYASNGANQGSTGCACTLPRTQVLLMMTYATCS
jgi:hypothetical protein